MVELIHEIAHLDFESLDLSFSVIKLLFLRFEVECLLVNGAVKLLHSVQRLGNFKFKGPYMAGQITAFVVLHFVGYSQTIDLLQILSVTFS